MVKLENTEVYGIKKSIYASGYPMSKDIKEMIKEYSSIAEDLSERHYTRAKKLAHTPLGTGHMNFLKGIIVQADLTYPQYFTPQLQRYHWVDIVSSSSKMHTLTHNKDIKNSCNKYVLPEIIKIINDLIQEYNETSNSMKDYKYTLFMQIISNLPMGYELTMAITTNYLQLLTIYYQRKTHKLQEDWGSFTDWTLTLPLFKELILDSLPVQK